MKSDKTYFPMYGKGEPTMMDMALTMTILSAASREEKKIDPLPWAKMTPGLFSYDDWIAMIEQATCGECIHLYRWSRESDHYISDGTFMSFRSIDRYIVKWTKRNR